MKAKEAPEKIYIFENPVLDFTKLSVKQSDEDIEYIRTDAFIEKAEKWLNEHWREYVNVDADGVVCFGHWKNDFRKAMEE